MANLTNCPDCKEEQQDDRILFTICAACVAKLIEKREKKS